MVNTELTAIAEPIISISEGRIYSVGTLRYTQGALWILFSWLMWNDLCLMLMENVAPNLVPFLLKDHGASNRDVAFFTATLTGTFTIWINPVVSTWSDRFRSRAGRRRPFLFFATPFCAMSLAAIPFMPDLFHFLQAKTQFNHFVLNHSAVSAVSFIGICYLCYAIFNSVILAIFSYYFWDVVPEAVLGRFQALTKVVSTVSVFIWNYFLFGLSEKHLKGVFVGVAGFFFVAYMLSLWRVKEGDYPPPPTENRDGIGRMIASYFSDCYQPYYLWFIVANALFQIGNLSNGFQLFFYRDQLHLNLSEIGRTKSLPTLLVVFVGYPMGSLVDHFKPGRVLICAITLYGITNIFAFYFLNGQVSMGVFIGIIAVIVCALQISQSVFIVEFFPREKLGQFCSANALGTSVVAIGCASVVGIFFDWTQNYRYAFLWSAVFYFISVPLYLKCYLNWRRSTVAIGTDESSAFQRDGQLAE